MIVVMKRDEGEEREEQRKNSPVLEINLISAQGLKPPSTAFPGGGRVQTYALAWVDSAAKLRTGVDKVGGENPTWNDRFLFRVSPEFLSGETSRVDVEIYAVGLIRDSLIGSVRLLIGNFLDAAARSPSFTALQIRRPSGRFQGVLNVGAMVIPSSDLCAFATKTAVGYRDLMGQTLRRQSRRRERRNEPEIFSDGDDSSTTSSSSSSTALKDLNTIRDLAGTKGFGMKASAMPQCSSFLCGLLREVQIQPRPSDERNVHHDSGGSQEKERCK